MENPSSLTYGRITWGLSSLICKAQMIMRTLLCSGEDDMEWDVWLAWLLYILGTLGTDTHRRRSVNSSSSWSFHTYTYCSGESPSGYKFFIWFKRQELFILFMEGRTLTFCKRKKKKRALSKGSLGPLLNWKIQSIPLVWTRLVASPASISPHPLPPFYSLLPYRILTIQILSSSLAMCFKVSSFCPRSRGSFWLI